jgi:hypothetical protein
MLGRLAALTTALLLALGAAPASGVETVETMPTTLTLTAPRAYADQATPVTVELTAEDGPLAGQTVTLDRRREGTWQQVATLVTDGSGRATSELVLDRRDRDNVVRARYDGDTTTYAGSRTGPVQLQMLRREGVVRVTGPDSVVDEREATLTIVWRTRSDIPVPGRVQLFRRFGKGDWKRVARPRHGPGSTCPTRHTPGAREPTRSSAGSRTASGDR